MAFKLAVHHKYIVSAVGGGINICELSNRISRIEINHVTILVGLGSFDECAVLFKSVIFVFGIFQKCELHGCITEFLVGEHAILDKYFDVIPLLFKIGTVITEDLFES